MTATTNSTAVAPEIVLGDLPSDLIGAIEREKLDKPSVKAILEEFELSVSLGEVSAQSRAIVVTDITQTDLMAQARELRLKLKDERIRIDKIREIVKKPYLLKTQAIDGIARILRRLFEAEEKHLLEQECFAQVQQQKINDHVQAEREAELEKYAYEGNTSGLYAYSDSQFELMVAGAKATYQQKLDDIARREREQKEQAEAAEKLRIENERLRKEKEDADRKVREAEAEAQRQRDAADAAEKARLAQIEEQKQEEARKERERLAIEEAEKKRVADEQAKAAAAPDREKLLLLADHLCAVELPTMSTEEGKALLESFIADREIITSMLRKSAENLRATSVANVTSEVPF